MSKPPDINYVESGVRHLDGDRRETIIPPPTSKVPYLTAILVMSSLGVLASVAILLARPLTGLTPGESSIAIGAVFAFLAPMTATIMTYLKAQETHIAVNSRLDAVLHMAKQASFAQGLNEGRTAGRLAADQRTDMLAGAGAAAAKPDLFLPTEVPAARRPDGSPIPRVEAPVIVVPPTR